MTHHLAKFLVSTALVFASVAVSTPAFAQMDQKSVDELLKELDSRQRALGDYKATIYMEQKSKGSAKQVFQAVTYRREREEKFVFLFMKPKAAAGSGYLRVDRSLFIYDPRVGRWERRTERERIGGTDSRRQDFDMKNLARDYTAKYIAKEKLGKRSVHHLQLSAKENAKVAFPVVHLWVDVDSRNPLKQQDQALSGKPLRTLYFPKWEEAKRAKGKGVVHYPREIRIYDELQKGNETVVVIQSVELQPLQDSLFTKAWLESKSR